MGSLRLNPEGSLHGKKIRGPQTKVFAAAARAASSAKALPTREKESHLLQTTQFLGSIVGLRRFVLIFFGDVYEIGQKMR